MQPNPMQPTPQQHFKYIQRQLHIFRKHHVSVVKQALILIAACAFVLYALLFTNVPALHDVFHGLRHALGIIPCH